MGSIFKENIERPHFAPLKGDASTDVLIVGGGIAGILAAYRLVRAGISCMLVEAKEILGGVTGNTTAKITIGHGLLYDKMIRRYGEEMARQYLKAQSKAGEEYERLAAEIDCDYEKSDSYVYSLKGRGALEREVRALCRLGVHAELTETPELPQRTAGAVRLKDQAQFHPLKFLYALARDLSIFEHTKVVELAPHKAVTNRGEIAYKKLIVATHFPLLNKHGLYFLKLYQHRSYVIALRGGARMEGMYVDACDRGLSFRRYGDLLLLGGGGHRTGKRGGCWQELEAFAARHYPDAEIVSRWATQDCMTLDGIPYIGAYAGSLPDVFVATGFHKWGMTNAMVASGILFDLVEGRPHPYGAVFSPSRSLLHKQLALNIAESVLGLLTPTVPRCPHLGCALKYNRAEHSWDCPCHGSRFSESGELLDNPATDDKRL